MRIVAALLILLAALMSPAAGQEETPWQTTITGQIEAFRAQDGTTALTFAAEGFLEQRGADYIVVDNKSQVVAYLKPNGSVQLSDYFWRQIGVKGAIQDTVDAAGVRVPVILVDDVILIQR